MMVAVDSNELTSDDRENVGRIDSWGGFICDVLTRMIRGGKNIKLI